ncbi:thiopeptide-type bacteriocin biosynthesis protein [Pseudonocardia nigra]|uniref:thiopeptide-type bacteriocin biosynthesis protein n=1 Tax=Pseudonocardia nigra TaxID=1921578 RepID=UPI001C5F5920|nr:thiopeptide-type bacteriocin biosynthesis protein [Pseudonocardia nigra]
MKAKPAPAPDETPDAALDDAIDVVEQRVWAHLTGTPSTHPTPPCGDLTSGDLAAAIAAYRAAGRAALHEARTAQHRWYQVRILFADWDTAEQIAATELAPRLEQARHAGDVGGWWYLRKHPNWRLRAQVPRPGARTDTVAAVTSHLDDLVQAGAIQRWRETIYEPEQPAFGGPAGMDIAHDLFHVDSRGALTYLARPRQVGRRELSILLCTALMRSARQDYGEQGDIWHRVAQLRPLSPPPPPEQLGTMIAPLHRLLAIDTSAAGPLHDPRGSLGFAAPWAAGLTAGGARLADLARDGALERGLRDVLANHVIFHWNRLGIPTTAQAVLARAARDTLLETYHDPAAAGRTG